MAVNPAAGVPMLPAISLRDRADVWGPTGQLANVDANIDAARVGHVRVDLG
jgi:hypothetical protein